MECSESLRFYFHAEERKEKRGRVGGGRRSSRMKGKGMRRCIRRRARHALDENGSWFGHLA